MARDSDIADLYRIGRSIPQISEATGVARSTIRFRLKRLGILRSRADGVRKAAADGRLGSGLRGKRRVFSDEHKAAIRAARTAWGEANAKGIRLTRGYQEYTTGPHKGRLVHVVKMEERIGRRLLEDEVVHHIDGDRANNNDNNLALLTRAAHTRLHRREQRLAEKGE